MLTVALYALCVVAYLVMGTLVVYMRHYTWNKNGISYDYSTVVTWLCFVCWPLAVLLIFPSFMATLLGLPQRKTPEEF